MKNKIIEEKVQNTDKNEENKEDENKPENEEQFEENKIVVYFSFSIRFSSSKFFIFSSIVFIFNLFSNFFNFN